MEELSRCRLRQGSRQGHTREWLPPPSSLSDSLPLSVQLPPAFLLFLSSTHLLLPLRPPHYLSFSFPPLPFSRPVSFSLPLFFHVLRSTSSRPCLYPCSSLFVMA